MTGPLDGIKILDLSKYLPGPFATQLLADFGAEVVKIEEPGGEPGRNLPPLTGGISPRYCSVNRNKKSITIDLKKPEGREVFMKLAAGADVVVDQFRPGVMDKLGLGYETLRSLNNRLIYCSITGYGLTGPWAGRAGHDINYMSTAGVSGLMAGHSGTPVIPAIQVADVAGGSLYAVIGILLAIYARTGTGKGQLCDIAMIDGALSMLAYTIGEWSGKGSLPSPGGELLTGGYAMYNVYACRDGRYVSLGALEQKFWYGFCDCIGRDDFRELQYVPAEQERLIGEISSIMLAKTRDEWVEFFSGNDICFTPVLDLDEVPLHEQVRAREMMLKVTGLIGSERDVYVTGNPVKLSDTPCVIKPVFTSAGADTESVLAGAGYSSEEIAVLRERGVI